MVVVKDCNTKVLIRDCNKKVRVNTDVQPSSVIGNYNELYNKPSINGVTLIGNKTSAELNICQTFVFEQMTISASWNIAHNLNKFPSVTIVDSGENVVIGDITYVDENNIIVNFNAPFSGKAYLN